MFSEYESNKLSNECFVSKHASSRLLGLLWLWLCLEVGVEHQWFLTQYCMIWLSRSRSVWVKIACGFWHVMLLVAHWQLRADICRGSRCASRSWRARFGGKCGSLLSWATLKFQLDLKLPQHRRRSSLKFLTCLMWHPRSDVGIYFAAHVIIFGGLLCQKHWASRKPKFLKQTDVLRISSLNWTAYHEGTEEVCNTCVKSQVKR